MLDEWERNISDRIAVADQLIGRDIRGRLMSEDVHELVRSLRKELPAKTSDADQAAWFEQQMQRFQWFQAYWNEYPGLSHNRDMFAGFLAKNHLQQATSHGPNVSNAESALLAALASGRPSLDWAPLAHALREAYIAERSDFVKNSRASIPANVIFSGRATPCAAPARTTTGNPHPRIAQNPRSLDEYWPFESKRLGEEGTVIAAVRIAATGCVTAVAIVGSSGSDMLDGTVLKYLETAEFIPADSGGKPAPTEVMIPIVFKLQ
jgi:TonB family protein